MRMLEVKDSRYFKDMIIQRIKRNKNFLGAFVGGTGSGKSYSALSFLETLSQELGTSFDASHVVFTPEELLKIIRTGNLESGSCIMFDESGVTYSARQWQSINNQLINYLLETFRDRNYLVLFTVPNINFIDKVARTLLHCIFETQSINYHNKFVSIKPFMIQISRFGKTYYKYLKFYEEGCVLPEKVYRLNVYLASKGLIADYEKKKRAYTDKLYIKIEADIREATRPKKRGRPKKDIDDILESNL